MASSNGKNSKNGRERLGICLIVGVLCLYVLGLVLTVWHLPSPIHRRRGWVERGTVAAAAFGRNINISRFGLSGGEYGDGNDGDDDNDSDDESGVKARNGRHSLKLSGGVPPSLWPVSIRDEDGNFEEIIHPGHAAKGHNDVTMDVPRFWIEDPVAVHENKLMSKERALSIGSCVKADADGNHARGEECPVSERTIFVAIASYRDYQCRDTVTSIFARAKYPDRVRVAVVDQIVEGEDGPCDAPYVKCSEDPTQELCRYKSQLDVFQVDAPLAVGPVFARHLGHRMYRGEYYSTQSDAHVTYTRDWDVDIISQLQATNDEMAVLSTYLTDIDGSIDANGDSKRNTRPIMCNTDYEAGQGNRYLRHGSQPEAQPTIRGTPQLEPYWAAGYSFSRGHFVVNVPYDLYQPMIFQGEEMSIGIRGFTIGYDFYAPERSVCFHHYANGKNAKKRNRVPHYWENTNTYAGSGIKAMKRLLGIVHMNPEVKVEEWDHAEEAKYGLGGVRTPELFYETFGVDVVNKVTEQHLCQFVESGKMHRQFMPFLREDGMGIDYGRVDYKFKDPVRVRIHK